jgi:hypothetical protein
MEDGELHVCTLPDALLSCTKTARKILVRAVSADALVFFFSLLARVNKQSPPTYLRARKRNPRHVLVRARPHAQHATQSSTQADSAHQASGVLNPKRQTSAQETCC